MYLRCRACGLSITGGGRFRVHPDCGYDDGDEAASGKLEERGLARPEVADLPDVAPPVAPLGRHELAPMVEPYPSMGTDQLAAWEQISAAGDRISAAGERAAAALERQEAGLGARCLHDPRQLYRDELTGVLLRAAGRDQLRRSVDRARRTGEPLVVAFLDVDHLKRVNDAQGHATGDHLLRELGVALRQGLRSYDILVRHGGDEFVCGLPGCRLAEAERRFTAVREGLRAAVAGASVSIGLAELRPDESLDQVIGRADRQMYDRRRRRSPAPSAANQES